MSTRDVIGYVLSRARSNFTYFQPRKEAEMRIREGMFVVISSQNGNYLGEIASITHYNEYYEVGEVWVEALREGYRPPQEIARRFTVAATRILGILTPNGLANVDKPPLPGDPVYPATNRILRHIYKYVPGEEERPGYYIEIGLMYGYEDGEVRLPAILDLRAVNMHFAVIGTTGSGKSNTVGKIIEELGKIRKLNLGEELESYMTIPAMLVDANGDYVDYFERSDLVERYSKVIRLFFSGSEIAEHINFTPSRSELREIKIDLNAFTPTEIAEAIVALYHAGRLEGAELQLNYLSSLLSDAERLAENIPICSSHDLPIDYNCVFHNIRNLENLIEEDKNRKIVHSTTAEAVKRAIRNFYELMIRKHQIVPSYREKATINDIFVDELTNPREPKLAILDFSAEGATGVDLTVKQFIVYNILALLFKKFTGYRVAGENRLLLFVIEEAQNYAPNLQVYPIGFSIAKKVLAAVATQGRKFGLCLGLVTQRPSYVDPIVMSMMNTFIIHRIAPGDVRFVDTVTGGLPRHIRRKLTYMEPGLAVLTGQMNIFPYPVLIKVARRESHKIGGLIG